MESREWEAKLKNLRLGIRDLQKEVRLVAATHDHHANIEKYEITEENIKALQSVGQIIGEVLKQLDEERCKLSIGRRRS